MYFRGETQVHGAVCIYWVFFQRTLIGMGFSTFDDAHAFLMEAKGLPSIPSASTRLRLCVRTCILLSWVALEDGLDCQIDAWGGARSHHQRFAHQVEAEDACVSSAALRAGPLKRRVRSPAQDSRSTGPSQNQREQSSPRPEGCRSDLSVLFEASSCNPYMRRSHEPILRGESPIDAGYHDHSRAAEDAAGARTPPARPRPQKRRQITRAKARF